MNIARDSTAMFLNGMYLIMYICTNHPVQNAPAVRPLPRETSCDGELSATSQNQPQK